jgi:hypothetical protein
MLDAAGARVSVDSNGRTIPTDFLLCLRRVKHEAAVERSGSLCFFLRL